MGKRTNVVPSKYPTDPCQILVVVPLDGMASALPTKDSIGPPLSPCSLTELLGRRAQVDLTFNRKIEAPVTLLRCAETVKMLFFVAALPVVRCRQKCSVWVLEEGAS